MRANFSEITIKIIKTRLKALMAIRATTQNQSQPRGKQAKVKKTSPQTSKLLDPARPKKLK